jgi:outer membrane protein assembly factor BamB
MRRTSAALLALALGLGLSACRPARPNMAPRPETLGFPLIEEKALPFEGTANGPVRVRYGTAYFTTEEGFLYSVDVLSQRILWRFKADRPLPSGPELGDESVSVRDEGNTIYVLDTDGRMIFKTTPADPVTTPVREFQGRIYFGCGNGRIAALDVQKNGQPAWEYDAGTALRSGPIFLGSLVIFGTEDSRLMALDSAGKPVWTFIARGAVRVDPAASAGRIYFGTEDRYFYCLAAATGKKKWVFRLAGAPVRPPASAGKLVIFAASDSVVYCLRARNGEIVWWQPVPSRVVQGLSVADGVVLASSSSPDLVGFDLKAGFRTGSCRAAGDLRAGAEWATPYVVIIEPDPASAGERIVFLKRDRRPVETFGKPDPVRR